MTPRMRPQPTSRALLLAALLAGSGCGEPEETMDTPAAATLRVTSSAFEDEGAIPARFTCDGQDASPPLSWSPGPDGTVSYALIVEDPDAPGGTWAHWVAWNLVEPRLREGVPPDDVLADGTRQGRNSWRRTGYGGPCPPSGTHRYFFGVHALDTTLDLPPDTDAAALRAAMRGHVLARGELLGLYTRAR
jgi:Raf kinase inhibitor-like YbhB/YbcL family protein